MGENPFRDRHVVFARALAALCREHAVGSFDGTFSQSFSGYGKSLESWGPERVRVVWGEGRHGTDGRLSLHATAQVEVAEKEPRP